MFGMDFLTPIYYSLLASAIYDAGIGAIRAYAIVNRTMTKRYEKAFEKALCRFYADPKYAGNEARQHYEEYLEMLQDVSRQDDLLSSSNQVYKKMLDLFEEEVSKDWILQCYTIYKRISTTQRKIQEINERIKECIGIVQSNHEESKREHEKISEEINGLRELITNPQMQNLTLAPFRGSAIKQNIKESHIICRKDLVERCIKSLDAGKLLILYGALKVGKTTLAQLTAEKRDGIEIIDDVAEEDLEKKVASLLATHKEGQIIVTTPSALNKNLSILDFSLIDQMEIPLLSVVETIDLINTFNPTSDLHNFIYAHTSGHPVLVKTLCFYFSTCEWKLDEENFEQILSYSFDHDLVRALSNLMGRIITDNETRILLNRLTLVNGSFTEAEACQLAEVVPQIEGVRSRLYSLIPTWVADNRERFNLSPLLNKLWRADISRECQKQCNKILSQNILSLNRPLNEQEVFNYIIYSVQAEEYDNAGWMYITVLKKLHDLDKVLPEKSLLRGIWIDIPLPTYMSLEVKIKLRLTQLLLLNGMSKGERHYLLKDLKYFLESYEDNDFKAFLYGAVTIFCLQENDVEEGLKYYNIYSTLDKNNILDIMSRYGEKISLLDNNIWILLLSLTSVDDYKKWLDTFRVSRVSYVHIDREVCHCCYLSISRLIEYHLRENDIAYKQSVLKEIWDKAEECKCPEVAIVCLFKILDLFVVTDKYDEAQVLYNAQYEKYKNYPLATILLNGAMAYVCYRSKQTSKRNWCYFEQVIKNPHKELIPSVQLHTREIFAYIVAEEDPKQGVMFLNEALEYANDENHKADIFEYYQCKGELSYAYWCIDERAKAVELLSECVDFVLPLAEAEKNFARTYLCLCNCLITKYSMDVQNKSLPENQAPPERGMFTENNPVGLDDLYTEKRLFLTCFQMSDLCMMLQKNALAYKWAKKTIEICRKNGKTEEIHSLLFLLLPLLKADVDLDDMEFIIRHSDQARRIAYQLHPELLIGYNDLEFVEFQIIPLLMVALTLKVQGNDVGIELVKSIVKEYKAVVDKEAIKDVRMVFEQDTYNRIFIKEIKKLNLQKRYSVYLCAYIMTAYYSEVNYAFDLLIAIMPELQKQLVQVYGVRIMTIVNRFITTFWKMKIFRNPNEFNEYDLLKDKGLKLIDEYENKLNQANKTMNIISHHLKSESKMNTIQEDWLNA